MYIIVETQNQTGLPVLTVFAAIQCSSDGGVPDVPGNPAEHLMALNGDHDDKTPLTVI